MVTQKGIFMTYEEIVEETKFKAQKGSIISSMSDKDKAIYFAIQELVEESKKTNTLLNKLINEVQTIEMRVH